MMVMEDMLKDFLLGEHLLLVGNQVSQILFATHGTNSLFNNEIKSLFCFFVIAFISTTEVFGPFFNSLFNSVQGFYGHTFVENVNAVNVVYMCVRVKSQGINHRIF